MFCKRLSGMKHFIEIIDDLKVDHGAGVYILYLTRNGPPRYVGRSDKSLYNRLKDEKDFKYYRIKQCRNKIEAYKWECKYWHKYQNSIENSYKRRRNHPAKPARLNVRCPVCGRMYGRMGSDLTIDI